MQVDWMLVLMQKRLDLISKSPPCFWVQERFDDPPILPKGFRFAKQQRIILESPQGQHISRGETERPVRILIYICRRS